MKTFTIMRRVKGWGRTLQPSLALLYLLLSLAAAWHAPHDLNLNSNLAYENSNASQSQAGIADVCALCSWQSLQQQTVCAVDAVPVFARLTLSEVSSPDAPAPGFSPAHLARGPPSV